VSQFKYLRTTVTNKNLIKEEFERILNSGNVCYHSIQNFLLSCVLSKKVKISGYKTKTSPLVLYGCETWSLTWREERSAGPKRNEETGMWRKLHNGNLRDLYPSSSEISMMNSRRMTFRHLVRIEEKRNSCRLLVGKLEGYKPLGKPRRRWM
jgi:hypothetical protein